MKLRQNKVLLVLAMLVILLLVITVSSCGKGGKKNSISGMCFLEETITIEKYENYSLALSGAEGIEIEWKSENEDIATVEDGIVLARQQGHTNILACVGKDSISCEVVVLDNGFIPFINLNETHTVNMGKNGEYFLEPTIIYNEKSYDDASFSFTTTSDILSVDSTGLIVAKDYGYGTVSISAQWRGNELVSSLQINVIDDANSIEVGSKVYNIYLNGDDKEYQSKADLDVQVFEDYKLLEAENLEIEYIEKNEETDVPGAAYVKNGTVYANKIGTTHLVAKYAGSNATFESAIFEVNVLTTPADKYMAKIEGEEFVSFIVPVGAENYVEWDESMQAFHLVNNNKVVGDSSGFFFDRGYVENILKYTDVRSIEFEFKTDGIDCGAETEDKCIYQSFYPQWFDDENTKRYELIDEWKKVEFFFEDFSVDGDGKLKSLFLLNTVEGLYVRNITLNLPPTGPITKIKLTNNNLAWVHGADTGLTGGHNGGTVSCENGVVKIADCYAYALHEMEFLNIDKVYGAGGTLRMKIKATPSKKGMNNLVLNFYNFETEGGIGEAATPCISKTIKKQGEWVTIEMDMDMFLNDEGRFNGLTIGTFGYQDWNSGEMYTFEIKDMEVIGNVKTKKIKIENPDGPITNIDISDANAVWIAGDATGLTGGHSLGTITYDYNKDILKIADCYAYAIRKMEVLDQSRIYKPGGTLRLKIKATPNASDVNNLTMKFYNNNKKGSISDDSLVVSSELIKKKGKWVIVDLDLDKFLNKEGRFEGFTFALFGYQDWNSGQMYTVEIKDVQIYGKYTIDEIEEEDPDGPISNIDISGNNAVWAHGDETGLTGGNGIGTFTYDYTREVLTIADCYAYATHKMELLDLSKIYKPGGTLRLMIKAIPNQDNMSNLTLKFFNVDSEGNISDEKIVASTELIRRKDEWVTVDLELDKFLNKEGKFEGFSLATFGYQDWTTGQMYTIQMKDVQIFGAYTIDTTQEPEVTGPITEIDLSLDNTTWTHGEETGLTGVNNIGTLSYDSGTKTLKIADCYVFSGHEMKLNDLGRTFASGGTLRFQVKATPNQEAMNNLEIRFYNHEMAGHIGESVLPYEVGRVRLQGEWVTIDLNLDLFLDENDKFSGLSFATFGYQDWTTGQQYTVEIKDMHIIGEYTEDEMVEPEDPEEPDEPGEDEEPIAVIDLEESKLSWTHGDEAGLTGGHGGGNLSYTDGAIKIADCYAYAIHKMTFLEESNQYASGNKLRMKVKATPNASGLNNLMLRFYNCEATGGIDGSAVAYEEVEITEQGEWVTIELDLDMFLDYERKFNGLTFATFGYQDWTTGQQYTVEISDVEIYGDFYESSEDIESITAINLAEANLTWTHGNDTGLTGGNNVGNISYAGGQVKIANCYAYAVHKMMFADANETFPTDALLRMKIKATPNGTGLNNLLLRLYNCETSGGLDDTSVSYVEVEITEQGEWVTVEVALDKFLDADGKYRGIAFATYGYQDWSTGQMYTIDIQSMEVVTEVSAENVSKIEISSSNITCISGEATGLTGGNNVGNFSVSGEKIQLSNAYVFAIHELRFADTSMAYESGSKVQMKIKATPNVAEMNNLILNFYNVDTEGGIGDSTTPTISKEIKAQGETVTIEMDLDMFLDSDNKLNGFTFATFGYNDWKSGEMYTIEIESIEILN